MSRNQEYWTKRMTDLEASLHRDAEAVVADLETMYRGAERQIEADLSRWYGRFANNNGVVSMADARKLLTSGELKEFKWTLKEYEAHARDNGNGQWNKELENASARWHISRLESLKYQLQNTVEELAGGQSDALDVLLKQTYQNGYGQTAFIVQSGLGVGWDFTGLSVNQIKKALQKPWALDGRNFSNRIWENKQALVGELHKQLTQNLMTGGDLRKVIDDISKKFNTSYNNAARLVYTESAYVRSVSSGESYRALGVEKVYFIAVLDERTSAICQSMDGSVIDMKDYQPGVTVPPLHPWCRSTTAPYYKELDGIGERAARDPETGKTYFVPRNMTYPEWEKTFMNDNPEEGSKLKEKLTAITSGSILKLADCQTVQDVEQYMKDTMSFRSGTVNLSGVDLESAKAIAEAYEEVFTKYPFLSDNIDAVSAQDLGSRTYAECYTRAGGKINVNRKFFKNAHLLSKSYEGDLKSGFHPAGTDWKSIVTHELGHALDGYLSNLGIAGKKNSWMTKDVSAMLRPKVMKACGLKVADAGREVSYYATKNAREWFAESFAEAMKSGSPRKVAVEFMKQLTKLINENGVK